MQLLSLHLSRVVVVLCCELRLREPALLHKGALLRLRLLRLDVCLRLRLCLRLHELDELSLLLRRRLAMLLLLLCGGGARLLSHCEGGRLCRQTAAA